MKYLALSTAAVLGLSVLAAPVHAAVFAWNVEYSGWWEDNGGGSLSGIFSADEDDALDGIISIDEMLSWAWSWSGNADVSAFSISSSDPGATADFSPSFYINGTPNLPIGADFADPDKLDQGSFSSGNQVIDLQSLLVISYHEDGTESLSAGNPDANLGTVSVSDPTPVPEPTALLGLVALLGTAGATLKSQKQEA